MVTRCNGRNVPAHFFHHAGSLVSENGRQWRGKNLIAHDEVGMANPGTMDFDQDFIVPRFLELNLLDDKRA